MGSSGYDGEPLDLAWQSDLKDVGQQRDGKTVGGSNGDVDGQEKSEFWPSKLPRDAFERGTSKQADVIEKFVQFPDAERETIADMVGCHINTVRRTLQKAVLFADPSDLPFDAEVASTSDMRYLQPYFDHQDARFDGEDEYLQSAVDDTSEAVSSDMVDVEEIARRYYEAESQDAKKIAEDLGLTESQVYGYLAHANYNSLKLDSESDPDATREEETEDEDQQRVSVSKTVDAEGNETNVLDWKVVASVGFALAIAAIARLIKRGEA